VTPPAGGSEGAAWRPSVARRALRPQAARELSALLRDPVAGAAAAAALLYAHEAGRHPDQAAAAALAARLDVRARAPCAPLVLLLLGRRCFVCWRIQR
jgi:hypothetical protein